MAGQIQTPQDIPCLPPPNRELPGQLHPHGCVWPMVAGAGTALLGKEGAMACTVAVEESIAQHYNNQIRTLMEEDPEKYEELLQVLGVYQAEGQACQAQRSRGAHVPLGRRVMGLIQEAAPLITVGNGKGVSPRPSAPLWIWSFSAEPFCVEASLLMPVALFPQQIQPGCIFFFPGR